VAVGDERAHAELPASASACGSSRERLGAAARRDVTGEAEGVACCLPSRRESAVPLAWLAASSIRPTER
jgi:hypothetical protein